MRTYRGSCHCGAVVFEIDSDLAEVAKCDCSLCTKKNAVMTGVHESRFRILKGEDKLTLYQWNTKTAKHYFCGICGIYPFHRRRVMPDQFGINVCCLEGVDASALSIIQFDGKSLSTVG